MNQDIVVSIDAMGGDNGPAVILAGCANALTFHPALKFILHGDEAQLSQCLKKLPALEGRAVIEHAEVSIAMDEKPSQALRNGRGKSSMWCALQSVKDGHAHLAVSAGNTGALMAMSKFCLRMLAGVDRPVIAAIWPTLRGETIVLDVGANIGADGRQLATMGVLGAAMARALLPVERPSVGLLNIGEEEVKGQDSVREAAELMRHWNLRSLEYFGFVEGNDIGKGTTDVVVTEGFAGNIALKTAEGTANQLSSYFKQAMTSSLMARVGAFFAAGALRHLKRKLDPRRANGGVFLGLNGIVIKSHGSTDAVGFAHAIEIGVDMAANELNDKIQTDVALISSKTELIVEHDQDQKKKNSAKS